jgi:hypothetical protein
MRSMLCVTAAFGLFLAGASGVRGQSSEGADDRQPLTLDQLEKLSVPVNGDRLRAALVDGLIQQLKSSKQGDRVEAILAIKKIGPGAKAAIPALAEVASNDPEVEIRELAKGCLDVIRQPIVHPDGQISFSRNLPEAVTGSSRVAPEGLNQIQFTRQIPVHLKDPITEAIVKARKVVGGDLYSVVTINNKTRGPINYSYRWGNGEWRYDQTYPDRIMSYSYKYKFVNEHKSPSFEVRFDRNVSQTATWIVYDLKRNPSPTKNPAFGHQYDFQQSDGSHIILKER